MVIIRCYKCEGLPELEVNETLSTEHIQIYTCPVCGFQILYDECENYN